MGDSRAPIFSSHVRSALGAMLKSDIAIDVLSPAQWRDGSFRNFVSRTISVIDVQGAPIALRKGAPRSGDGDVHLLRLQRGSAQLLHKDGCTHLQAGQFVAFRGAQTQQFRHEQSIELLAVFLPARALERWLPDWQAAEFVTVANHQAEGRLAFEIARDLLGCGRHLRESDAAELVGETVARLMARSLGMTSLSDAAAPADLAEGQRRKVRHFCRRQLGSTSLTVDTVARATGLSRASLHRLFREEPHTLMQWVQLERLEACRRLLEAPGLLRRTLTEIALSHGFKTPGHFSAAFRQRYGLTPRDYRAQAGAAQADKREPLAQARETQP
jgi:AraC family transcriptional regulator, positive regulator of tynA and feaB